MTLALNRVSKRYRSGAWGLQAISVQFGPGLHGLLGPNGAGKSTLMRLIATISRPTSGGITWNGQEITERPEPLRAVIGYLPQDVGVYAHLSAVEFLDYLAAVKGLDRRAARRRIAMLLELLNLTSVARRPLGGLSGGTRQRVGIAQALLNDPQLLIIDEPTTGLDPQERVRLHTLLAELAERRVIILSTHIVSEVEASAATLTLLHQGRLLAHTTPAALIRSAEGWVWEWEGPAAELGAVQQRHRLSAVSAQGATVHMRVIAGAAPVPGARLVVPTLEDAYVCCVDRAPETLPTIAPTPTASQVQLRTPTNIRNKSDA